MTHALRACVATCLTLLAAVAAAAEPSGAAGEKRFPPLELPPGFRATLFACDPFIEYPSVIAAGPRPGTLFIAVDYMTGLGTGHVRHDEIRLLEDTDGDGYADKSTVFAAGFNSVQGLAWHGDTLFVMHAPFLSAVRSSPTPDFPSDRSDLLSGWGFRPSRTRSCCIAPTASL